MATGTVKWFNNAKGYGFVLPEAGGDDLFIHYSSIQMDGYKSLKAGQEVMYELQEGPKGMHAVDIRPTGPELGAESTEVTPQAAEPLVEMPAHLGNPSDQAEQQPATISTAGNLAQAHQLDSSHRVALEEH